MFSSVPLRRASCASSIAQASPAGPAPTTSTSSSIRSPAPADPSRRIRRSMGSGGLYRAGTNCSLLPAPSAMEVPDLVGQLRDDVKQIADDSVVSHLEDRGVLFLVDRDDDFRRAYPRQVLDRARDPYRDIERGTDGLARLAHLVGMRPAPRIHHRP